jgi:hypothetical protein
MVNKISDATIARLLRMADFQNGIDEPSTFDAPALHLSATDYNLETSPAQDSANGSDRLWLNPNPSNSVTIRTFTDSAPYTSESGDPTIWSSSVVEEVNIQDESEADPKSQQQCNGSSNGEDVGGYCYMCGRSS